MRAVVVGAGSWGTAFARVLRDRGHEVTLACRTPSRPATIAETGRNPRYLPEVDLRGIAAFGSREAPVADADVVAVSVPSRAFGEVVGALPGGAPVLTLTKGLDPATGELLLTLVGDRPVAVLSGPNFAEEVAAGLPCAAVIASARRGARRVAAGRRSTRRSSASTSTPTWSASSSAARRRT